MFPEYTPTVMAFEATDALRRARWALDAFRLNKAGESGTSFALVIETWLGFGTPRAIEDIETAIGYGGAVKLRLASTPAGNMELISKNPSVRAVFSPDESRTFFEFIATLPVDLVVIHHLLGYSSSFIKELTVYVQDHKAIYYAHDFFSFCPRVTMIDAAGGYCRRADTDRCALCVEIGGSHAASRLTHLGPVAHRELFASLLGCVQQVVVPSRDTAGHFAAVFPRIKLCVVPHPQVGITFPPSARLGDASQIVLLGAIGPHKGSARLLDLAKLARLTHPRFHFHVIGYTDIDDQLASMPNVTITGRYSIADLPARIAKTGGTLALFLHEWPETFLYTLTEAVAHGLVPVVPDIGAPAERVRDAGFGVVYPFPVDVRQVLSVLDGIQHGQISVETGGATPQNYREANAEHVTSLQQLAQSPLPPTSPAAARPSPARRRTAPHGG
jgi:glycosyltransferase involved in cell wall biosynthesis